MKIKLFVCLWLLTCGSLLQAMNVRRQSQFPQQAWRQSSVYNTGQYNMGQGSAAFGGPNMSKFSGGQRVGPQSRGYNTSQNFYASGGLNSAQNSRGLGGYGRPQFGGYNAQNRYQQQPSFQASFNTGGHERSSESYSKISEKDLLEGVKKVIELLDGLSEQVKILKEGQRYIIYKLDKLPELILSEVMHNINYFKDKQLKGGSN